MNKLPKFAAGAILALFAFMAPFTAQGAAAKGQDSSVKSSKYKIASSKAPKRRVTNKASFSKKRSASEGMSASRRKRSAARAVKAARTFESHGLARALASTDVFLSDDLAVDKMRFNSSIVLVEDAVTGDVVISKNADLRAPIASISKLMTALVTLESGENLSDEVMITKREISTTNGAASRLRLGTILTRSDLMHLALMASDNRAAHALARSSSFGYEGFIDKMNAKAVALGMHDTSFGDPSGLSAENRSTANDLVKLVRAAVEHEEIRGFSTDAMATFRSAKPRSRAMNFHTTNRLIANPHWQISLQKTGFTSAAGRCMVLYAFIDDRPYFIVLMDAGNTSQRIKDASLIQAVIQKSSSAFSAKIRDDDVTAVPAEFMPQADSAGKVSLNP